MRAIALLALALAPAALAADASPEVTVHDWEFRDAGTGTPLTNAEGTGVRWTVLEGIHTVRASTGAFASGPLFPGDRFDAHPPPGAHPYSCEIHEWMRGLVLVR